MEQHWIYFSSDEIVQELGVDHEKIDLLEKF